MIKPRIFGISGTNGSGKDTVGELLKAEFGYSFMSVSNALRDECIKRGWSTDREFTRQVSAEWRREFGMSVLVDRTMQAYEQSHGKYKGIVMASLRNPYEADRIHELGGTMIWVDADPDIRYKRISAAVRGRAEDNKTFEQFLKDDEAEMHPPKGADGAVLNMAAVKERCDIVLTNNYSSQEELRKALVDLGF